MGNKNDSILVMPKIHPSYYANTLPDGTQISIGKSPEAPEIYDLLVEIESFFDRDSENRPRYRCKVIENNCNYQPSHIITHFDKAYDTILRIKNMDAISLLEKD